MNQGIFGFRKYENSSLNYTGIDKHEGEAVGGWDTVLRREEYEELYSKQQATVTDWTDAITPAVHIDIDKKAKDVPKKLKSDKKLDSNINKQSQVQEDTEKLLKKIISSVKVNTVVYHNIFGDGTVVWIDKTKKKYIRIKFKEGEKQFIFPNAFIDGYLHLK